MIFFVNFPAAGNREKKKNNNYNEKKMVQIWEGYCPNRIVRKNFFVLQGWIVLQPRQLGGLKLGCNTLECVAIEVASLGENYIAMQEIVLQEGS